MSGSSHRILLLGLLVLVSFSSVHSQNYTVSAVDVRGNRTAEKTLILTVSDLTVGSVLSSTATQDAIRKIYGLGLFSDVQIMGDVTGNNNIALVIQVTEYPRIIHVDYAGNNRVKDKDLQAADSIKLGQLMSPNQVQTAVNRLKSLYQEKGYYLVSIRPEVKPENDSSGDATLKFKIDENQKIRIRSIEFDGNHAFKDAQLRGKLGNKPKGFLRSGNFDPDKHEKDLEKLVEFYHEKGYVDASVVDDTVIVDTLNPRWMTVRFEVYEGPRYRFGDSKFTGQSFYGENVLRRQLKYDPGDFYSQKKYDGSLENLYSIYQEEGYIHARVYDNVTTADSTLNVEYEVNEGAPAKINRIEITGNSRTKDKVVRRELFSRPGQIFKRSVLMRSVRNVMVLNYFSNVTPDFKVLPNGDVDLILTLVEKPTGQFSVGAGYSGQDKLVGTISIGMPNFRGNGQTLTLSSDFGARRNSVSIGFTEPWVFDTPTSLGVSLYNLNRQWYEDFWEGRRGGSLQLGRRLRWPDNYFKVYGSYRLEASRYYDFSTAYKESNKDNPYSLLALGEKWRTVSAIAGTITRDSRDLSMFATRGSEVSWTSEYAGGPLGGEWRYHKHTFEASKFFRLFWSTVIAAKVKVGVIDSPHGDNGIPYSERFSPGGTDPDGFIRGYEDGDVTPKSANGTNLRGRSMLVYNLEYHLPIVEQQIYGLLFFDAGNSWLAGKYIAPFSSKQLYKGAGLGFRLVVPGIGVIGFDFGYGFDAPKPGWKPHFQVGTTF